MSLRVLNPNAEVMNKSEAVHMDINAAKGLQDILKTNLGPKGTIKMWRALSLIMVPSRHPDMKRRAENCYILACNVSLVYEKSEINAGFFYSNAEQRAAMVAAERKSVDERVNKIIELKNQVCAGNDINFVVINQKGIDPSSLHLLQQASIKDPLELYWNHISSCLVQYSEGL